MDKKQNAWLDALIAALAAKRDHEKALGALVAHHGGKRTLPLMEDLLSGIRAICPETKAEITARAGMPNVTFPGKGAGYGLWKEMILPHLPKLRAATGGKRDRVDPVLAEVKRLKGRFTAAQLRRIIAALDV